MVPGRNPNPCRHRRAEGVGVALRDLTDVTNIDWCPDCGALRRARHGRSRWRLPLREAEATGKRRLYANMRRR